MANLTMPTFMTKWYTTFVFLFQVSPFPSAPTMGSHLPQIVAIFTSTFIVNRDNLLYATVVLFVCTLNLMLVWPPVLSDRSHLSPSPSAGH
jgi:hypothetical protein